MTNVHGVSVQGATYCVPIWHEYMAAALWHHKVLDFPLPDRYPTWRSISRGSYGYLGSYSSTTTTAATTTTAGPPPPPIDTSRQKNRPH
jgi:membrane carboxypeptidase/penicillin-binding protein